MHSRRLTLALSSGLLCLSAPSQLLAQPTTAAPAPGAPMPAAPAAATAPANTAATPSTNEGAAEEWETKWVPWDSGEDEATLGIGVFGFLGLDHRLDEAPPGAGTPTSVDGLRIGLDAVVRPLRWLGFGVGYEHASAERDRNDIDNQSFRNTYHSLKTLWVDARAYPLRLDPFALYVDLGAGPSWQSLRSDYVNVEPASAGQPVGQSCSGNAGAALGLRGSVGAELGLSSGAVLWGDFGPSYYMLSEDKLDDCDVGSGDTVMFGFRAGFAVGFEKTRLKKEKPASVDDDLDTIANDVDACPTVAGVPNADPKQNGCPLPPPKDTDADGVFDDVDACVSEAGIANADAKKHGCPPPKDTDADGVTDDVDACVSLPGLRSDDPKANGCPGDTDGDGFRDDQDGCPQEKGVDDADPAKRGCPKLVRVTDTEIIILEQVQFDTGKATIKPASDPLLDSVADVLKQHPEILRLEVQGHTDNKGNAKNNKKLSQNRAESVKKALVSRGVEDKRLEPKGYGQEKPAGDNKTEEGRAANRRVQFVVLEKKSVGPAINKMPLGGTSPIGTSPAAAPATPAPAPVAPAPVAPATPVK